MKYPGELPTFLGTFKTNAKTYKVYAVSDMATSKAFCDHERGIITVAMADGPELKDRLMHECVHAMLDAYGISHLISKSSLDEEDLVHALTPALLGTFKIKIPLDIGGGRARKR